MQSTSNIKHRNKCELYIHFKKFNKMWQLFSNPLSVDLFSSNHYNKLDWTIWHYSRTCCNDIFHNLFLKTKQREHLAVNSMRPALLYYVNQTNTSEERKSNDMSLEPGCKNSQKYQ